MHALMLLAQRLHQVDGCFCLPVFFGSTELVGAGRIVEVCNVCGIVMAYPVNCLTLNPGLWVRMDERCVLPWSVDWLHSKLIEPIKPPKLVLW